MEYAGHYGGIGCDGSKYFHTGQNAIVVKILISFTCASVGCLKSVEFHNWFPLLFVHLICPGEVAKLQINKTYRYL